MTIDEREAFITMEAFRLHQERGWPIEVCRISGEFLCNVLYGSPSAVQPQGILGRSPIQAIADQMRSGRLHPAHRRRLHARRRRRHR